MIDINLVARQGLVKVKLEGVVYVLHAFQKKSKRGIATPKPEIDLVKSRLQLAQQIHEKRNAP
ncbi:MAG: type II toxin-antitoxin system RelE/ParE family toxin [Magnetococcales bacterium]|nr:type II toxin-antitoxin system RelE/ParE family toxin [Magnetococcales bacterium]